MTTVTFDELTFQIHRSSRRTVQITVERGGQLSISAPQNTAMETLESIVKSKKLWIYTKMSEKKPLVEKSSKKQFAAGEGFYYLGRSYRLKIVQPTMGTPPLRLHDNYFELQDQSRARELFVNWYSMELNSILDDLINRFGDRISVKPGQVRVRDLGFKWGSCGKKGDLYFHWRIAMLPMRMIEYIVVHEMVHLKEHRHSSGFWEKVEAVLPNYGDLVLWLAENGAEYDL